MLNILLELETMNFLVPAPVRNNELLRYSTESTARVG